MAEFPISTLTQALLHQAQRSPDGTALIFIHENSLEERISRAQFVQNAQIAAGALHNAGVQPGDLVILVLRHSPTLLYAFWGAMFLGATASIFPFLTEKLDPELYMERVKALVGHAQAKAVITFPEFEAPLRGLLEDSGCTVLSTDELAFPIISPAAPPWLSASDDDAPAPTPVGEAGAAAFSRQARTAAPDDIAFLQHSSGTTGLQKGVALSHRAVLNQLNAYSRAINLSPSDVIVSWLPLYHDMGLIAGFVMPLAAGVPLVLMSPFQWVSSPKLLFQAIQRHRGTLCWLPNFAYHHLARGVRGRDLDGLDLRNMRAFINCSEPVFEHSHALFLDKFAPAGVQAQHLQVCYAMAENTFAVTQTDLARPAPLDWVVTRDLQEQRLATPAPAGAAHATPMVSCGAPVSGTEVRILDEHGQPLPERRVGEIALRSNCMLSGYYHRPELTAQAIQDGWYTTGDMGYLAAGQLYITGRKKDLIIVGGKNVYPQDLEAIANQIPGLVPGRCAAFGVMDERLGSESIVMVCEVEDDGISEDGRSRIEMELRKRVVQRSEVALADVHLVGRKWLIKTSSGKISRPSNREKYLNTLV